MKHIDVVVAVIETRDRGILISKRSGDQHLAGCWEFPGGKVDAGESNDQALAREIKEELGLDVRASEFLFRIRHDYVEKSVALHVFYVSDVMGEAVGREGQSIKWVSRSELKHYTFPAANARILEYFSE